VHHIASLSPSLPSARYNPISYYIILHILYNHLLLPPAVAVADHPTRLQQRPVHRVRRRSKVDNIGQKWSTAVKSGQHRSKVVNSGQKWSTAVKSGQQRSKVVNSGQKWSTAVKSGQRRSKVVNGGQHISYILYSIGTCSGAPSTAFTAVPAIRPAPGPSCRATAAWEEGAVSKWHRQCRISITSK
jgi:hypothetical protein